MKLMHLADLHLGKRVNGFSMIEDQKYILNEILKIMDEEQPEGLLIAGDVYDKSVPPAEAVRLMDEFLTSVAARNISVYMISGNHDSADRVSFGHQLMEESGIHISPPYDGEVTSYILENGDVVIHLIPFIRPSQVQSSYPEEEIGNYNDALEVVVRHMDLNEGAKHVLIAHQFVVNGEKLPDTCDSEQLSVGGLDQVDGAVFAPFDYVALGHLHGPQKVGRETIRYAGSPLKYSFSELNQKKSVTMISWEGSGEVQVNQISLQPLREMIELRGTFQEILQAGMESEETKQDYYHMILTDENDVVEALPRLREYYPNIMLLDYDNTRTRSERQVEKLEAQEEKSPVEIFETLYEQQNGQPMNENQEEILNRLIREIWEEEV